MSCFGFLLASNVAWKYCDNNHFLGVSALLIWANLETSSENPFISDPQKQLP